MNLTEPNTLKELSLVEKYPEIVSKWHPTKNEKHFDELNENSSFKAWWICKKGHEWQRNIKTALPKIACVYCINRKILIGFNDIATTHPEVAETFHPSKNGSLKVEEISAGSGKKIWWQCKNGHEWAQIVHHYVKHGCYECVKNESYSYLKDTHPQLFSELDKNKNLDIDLEKITTSSSVKVWWLGQCGHEWQAFVFTRTTKNSGCHYCAGTKVLTGFNDVFTTHAYLKDSYNFEKNTVEIEKLSAGSTVKVWWLCDKGHEWKSSVYVRAKRGHGCRDCNLSFLKDEAPHLIERIHPSLNPNVNIDRLTVNSDVNLWWLGECGHEWQRSVSNEVISKRACPICINRRVMQGVNDLESQFPYVANKLNVTRNPKHLSANNINVDAVRKVWWKCSKGHEWKREVFKQTKNDVCPYCSHKRVLVGFNDLETLFPDIAKEWNSQKNKIKNPQTILYKSSEKVWWKCDKGHEWSSVVGARTKYNSKCHVCSGFVLTPGFNDLATTRPEILKLWNYDRNTIKPTEVKRGANQKVWWKCDVDNRHEWQAQVASVASGGYGCPVCTGNAVIEGVNDVASSHPHLLQEWHPTKNSKSLYEVSAGSNIKIHWLGSCGHEWNAGVKTRVAGHGCPSCGSSSSKAENTIIEFLKEAGLSIRIKDRTLIAPYELDILIPDKNFAIEFNGVYWHDENHKPKNHHQYKWKACKDKGIQLIQVWEDDWNRNPNLVKRMLAHKLGFSQEARVQARKLVVKEVTTDVANEFLNEYHIQGTVDGGVRIGLFENITHQYTEQKPMAVIVLKREPGTDGKTLNLLRYATSANVVGGFTKLLKHVEREFKPESIVTFSDNTVSNGGLYENNGFANVKELKPDYMYVVKNNREHKFGYRLKRFREDPALRYEEGLSESELAVLNNIPRIWDAGKIKWEKKYNESF